MKGNIAAASSRTGAGSGVPWIHELVWRRTHRLTASHNLGRFTMNRMDDTASAQSASQADTSASNGTKRKRSTEPKFYAVRVGYQPGVYHTWRDCLEQVKGFKKAMC